MAAALTMTALPAPALSAGGKALGVNPDASALTGEVERVLTVGTDLAIGDTVITDTKGLVQILFEDKTELVVGPNSRLMIEDYLLRSDGSAGKLAINALAGTFRFATGGAAKDRYLIRTPTGTIGVRGTAFDFNVDEAGTRVLLFHGSVQLCNLANVCVSLDGACTVGSYDLSEALEIGRTDNIGGEDRKALRSEFRYADSQSPLMRQFWVENARQCLNKPFVGNTDTDLKSSSDEEQPPPPERPNDDDNCDSEYYSFCD